MAGAHSRILGVGGHLPERVVDNREIAAMVDTEDEWIVARTGIRERRLAAKGELASDLALAASRAAIDSAGVGREDIDLIIVATTTPDLVYPSTACILQEKLGIRNGCGAFDVQAVCSGFLYGLSVGDAMVRAGHARRALVVGAEVYSHILDWSDRSTCILFGDGAGAAVIGRSESPGIVDCRLHADGSHTGKLSVPAHVGHGALDGKPYTVMDGGAIYKLAVRVMYESSREVCAANGLDSGQVDWFIPHQANERIMSAVADRLGIREDSRVSMVERCGNTSAASIPLALSSIWERTQGGQHVLLTAVGGGLTWGAMLVRL